MTDSALLPEFDHLYLDMNGIIHGCTHPNHMDISDTLSERDMMLGIMHYLDRIITQIVKPKVSVYMAIDGVAPRAKVAISNVLVVFEVPKTCTKSQRTCRNRNRVPSLIPTVLLQERNSWRESRIQSSTLFERN